MTAVKVIGLDIGSRNVKIALVRRNGSEIELCDYVIAEAPDGAE